MFNFSEFEASTFFLEENYSFLSQISQRTRMARFENPNEKGLMTGNYNLWQVSGKFQSRI